MTSVKQDGYLNPMATFTDAQMQQMVTLNMNGLVPSHITSASGSSTSWSITSPAVHG